MYLSRIHLQNWRSYVDATFDFDRPTQRRPLVLIGAMNGHGKTSLLVGLYIGLFGRFGMRYCEGFDDKFEESNFRGYRDAIAKFRRNEAEPDDPTTIEITFSPSALDENQDEIRLVRRWHFGHGNKPKLFDSFETVELYRDGRAQVLTDLDSAYDKLEKLLFPPHILPAFFFDGEQAQTLINKSGTTGMKKAVETMFGARLLTEVQTQIRQYLNQCHNRLGGKRNASQRAIELREKSEYREALNQRIARLQRQEAELSDERDGLEQNRKKAHEELARLGGERSVDIKSINEDREHAASEKDTAERVLLNTSRELGYCLAVSRLAVPILNRLEAEAIRERWERLRDGTEGRADEVLAVAMPEPAERDDLLGHLNAELRSRVRDRFKHALTQIYSPPPQGCAAEYLLGHVKGDDRQSLTDRIQEVRRLGGKDVVQKANRLKLARDQYEDCKAKSERYENLPHEVNELAERVRECSDKIEKLLNQHSSIENDIKKSKADLHALNAEIGRLQEELAKSEPEQKRIAVAERISRALDDLLEKLPPIALNHLKDLVTKHFTHIADKRFAGAKIDFDSDDQFAPVLRTAHGYPQRIDTMSGFERRSFGIAFSLALAEITGKRIPLVIDTPLGNADSEYRPRLLDVLTAADLDQIIVLTHDQEVNGELLTHIEKKVGQKFLVKYDPQKNGSTIYPNTYFRNGV